MSYRGPTILTNPDGRTTAGLRKPDRRGKIATRSPLGAINVKNLPPNAQKHIRETILDGLHVQEFVREHTDSGEGEGMPLTGSPGQPPSTSPQFLRTSLSAHTLMSARAVSSDSSTLSYDTLSTELLTLLQNLAAEVTDRDAAEGATIFAAWLGQTPQSELSPAEAPIMEAMDTSPHTPTPSTPLISGKQSELETHPPKFNRCYSAIRYAITCGCCRAPIQLGSFHPTGYEVFSFGTAAFFGGVYGKLSSFKGREDLGDTLADVFSVFSAISNFAQMFLTLRNFPEDLRKKFIALNAKITTMLTGFGCFTCWNTTALKTVSMGITFALTTGIAGLSVITASSLASATLAATGYKSLAYIMWALRSALVFKSSIGIIDTLTELARHFYTTLQEVRNGDKGLLRALLEIGFVALSGYIATQYSLSQKKPMSEFAAANLNGIFGIDLHHHEEALGNLGMVSLMALNLCFIMGGGIKATEMCDRYHATLLISFFIAAPTGFPGVALIQNPDLLSTLIAYLSAALSNYASIAKLSYVQEKRDNDLLLQKLEQANLKIQSIRVEANRESDSSQQAEMKKLIFNCDILSHALSNVINQLRKEPSTTWDRLSEATNRVTTPVTQCLTLSGRYSPDAHPSISKAESVKRWITCSARDDAELPWYTCHSSNGAANGYSTPPTHQEMY